MNKLPREVVTCTFIIMYTLLGERFSKFEQEFPALGNDFEFEKSGWT